MNVQSFSVLVWITTVSTMQGFCQAPLNDHFTNRVVLSGSSITFTGTVAGATLESTEPSYSCFAPVTGGSVWWTWTATESTPVTIAILRDYTSFSSSNTWLQVCSGTDLNSLVQIDCNRFDGPAGRYVEFAAVAGTSYQFRVFGGWTGPFALKLTATNPPVMVKPLVNCTVSPYGSAFFWTVASGLPTPQYQWTFNGAAITGETAAMLAILDVQTNQAGLYSVIVSNSGGAIESFATLTVTATNPVPRLAVVTPVNSSTFDFRLTGEAGRWYKIESSSDATDWSYPGAVRYTNVTGLISVPRFDPEHQFARASLNVPTDVCIAHLKQYLAALNLWAIENKRSALDGGSFPEIRTYLPGGNAVDCPENGTYALTTVAYGITCTRGSINPNISRGHDIDRSLP